MKGCGKTLKDFARFPRRSLPLKEGVETLPGCFADDLDALRPEETVFDRSEAKLILALSPLPSGRAWEVRPLKDGVDFHIRLSYNMDRMDSNFELYRFSLFRCLLRVLHG